MIKKFLKIFQKDLTLGETASFIADLSRDDFDVRIDERHADQSFGDIYVIVGGIYNHCEAMKKISNNAQRINCRIADVNFEDKTLVLENVDNTLVQPRFKVRFVNENERVRRQSYQTLFAQAFPS